MPVISVIIPAYNAERTILETIESVRQQTFSDFEIIVINDGSTDNTLNLLDSIRDNRLKVFSYENGGLSVARNRGIAHASGDFIAFLDADDLWTPDKLELQLDALKKHPKAGIAYSWTVCMSEDGQMIHPGTSAIYQGDVYAALLVSNFIANGSNPLVCKQAIESVGEFDSSLKSGEDWDYWIRLAAANWPFVVVPKPQIFYRLSSTSMSSKIEVMEKYNLIVIERAFQSAHIKFQHLKKISLAKQHRFMAKLCLSHHPDKEGVEMAIVQLNKTMRLYPQMFFSLDTQKLIFKVLIFQIAFPTTASSFLRWISRVRSTPSSFFKQ